MKYYRYIQFRETEFTIGLRVEEYEVIRTTPKGVWIDIGGDFDITPVHKFILTNANKQWACPTKEAALVSFCARKRRQIKILKSQLEMAHQALAVGEGLAKKKEAA